MRSALPRLEIDAGVDPDIHQVRDDADDQAQQREDEERAEDHRIVAVDRRFEEQPPEPDEYVRALMQKLEGRDKLTILFEPGRAIMANAGILLTKVEFLKENEGKHFCIVDAAMNDLLRPALYSAWQKIEPIDTTLERETQEYDVVGPVCETGDFLGKNRELAVASGDTLVVRSAGAYGFTMSSNYNSRVRAAEIMVDGPRSQVVRRRESVESLWAGEAVLLDE